MPLAFTYNSMRGTDSDEKDRDYVRWRLGDTDEETALLDDGEIDYALSNNANRLLAAAECCRAIYANLSRVSGMEVEKIKYAKSADYYRDLEEILRIETSSLAAMPFGGGLSISAKQTQEDDSDRVKPAFTRETGSGSGGIGINETDVSRFIDQ